MFDTLLYGIRVFCAIQKRLPGVKMSGFMEVAVCDIWILFQAYNIENVIPVGYLPRIDIAGIFSLLFQRKSVSRSLFADM